ncbi:MAG: CoA-binding protein [Armatimonadota bacterium]
MLASDLFFSGSRYAIFGMRSPGRAHGAILVAALRKAGKTAVAIEPEGALLKGAEVYPTLAAAGTVDGVVLLPPSPWSELSVQFTEQALQECRQNGLSRVWIYPDGSVPRVADITASAGIDAVVGVCPCLHITGGGFPHNLHRWIAGWQKG